MYLVGFITSSVGPNVRIQEMDNDVPVTYIERSVKMDWEIIGMQKNVRSVQNL